MRKYATLLLIFCASTSWAAWDKGFNFRATSAFVADGPNETFALDIDTYPTTRNGVTFGWTSTPATAGGGGRDRNAGIDRRLAGLNFCANSGLSANFQIDLPAAAQYQMQLGFGDAGGNAANNYITVKDNTTPLINFQPLNTLATPTFGDAAGSTFTAAAWPGGEATVTKTFASTTLNLFMCGVNDAGTNSVITHLFLSQVAATGTSLNITPGVGNIAITPGTGNVAIK